MAQKLKKRVKKKWVAALRSGKYAQGKNALNHDGKFCCLGVLCEVALESGAPVQKSGHRTYASYGGYDMYPPPEVKEWAFLKKGLDNKNEVWVTSQGTLVSLNDTQNKTFAEIADIIEKEL